ncbi:hypothetical protein PDJAM_G00075180 [Pangasius djambal]|uniref:Uncharacterized protein n=1 Tax=Pangasius djambal TaxID=1691987 RepID=A0ACC5Z169_9TELE|nr:hypothetical protein [Pangasius djambal]
MDTTSPFNLTEMVPTNVAPNHRDSTVVGVVIVLVLCTLAGLVYLLYHYLCHNKGIYRTTGEAAPGVDPDQGYHDTDTENKEYFI